MILTDREIQIALSAGHIEIDPMPDPTAFSSTAVDLSLGTEGLEWQAAAGMPIRPGAPGYSYSNVVRLQSKVSIEGYTIRPGSFLLGWTSEVVNLPIVSRLAARVEGKSSLARIGLGIHVTAPTIHSGFRGQIQLEMYNFGPHDIILDPGMRVCQLIFEQTIGTPNKGYAGGFLGQSGG